MFIVIHKLRTAGPIWLDKIQWFVIARRRKKKTILGKPSGIVVGNWKNQKFIFCIGTLCEKLGKFREKILFFVNNCFFDEVLFFRIILWFWWFWCKGKLSVGYFVCFSSFGKTFRKSRAKSEPSKIVFLCNCSGIAFGKEK